MSQHVFLLSPANLSGTRAKQLASPRATFEAAQKYRSAEGVPIGQAFAFMSALYFRGKITYAQHFAEHENVFVITSGFGLVAPDWRMNEERLEIMAKTPVDASHRGYRMPLERDAEAIAGRLDPAAHVVLLGSVATGKYVDILQPIFGPRLRFPAAFAGLGDMSRGGLMLRAVRENRELEYVTLDAPRHRAPGASGKMPPLAR
jgi:hypothetical protein